MVLCAGADSDTYSIYITEKLVFVENVISLLAAIFNWFCVNVIFSYTNNMSINGYCDDDDDNDNSFMAKNSNLRSSSPLLPYRIRNC